jgi:hypothetical protein
MKVFISWSGDTSKAIAEILKGWLPSVIQAVKPYYTPDDITKGSRWNTEVCKELEESKVGLVCMTADNLEAPWIMFEAGALSKSLTSARVCPLLFGIEPSDIKGPLVQFQAAPFTQTEMKKTLSMINQELGPLALAPNVLESVFEMWWPKLDKQIKELMSSHKQPTKKSSRTDRDILEEILDRIRLLPTTPNIQLDQPPWADTGRWAGSSRYRTPDSTLAPPGKVASKILNDLDDMLDDAVRLAATGTSPPEFQEASRLLNECKRRLDSLNDREFLPYLGWFQRRIMQAEGHLMGRMPKSQNTTGTN